MCTRYDVLVKRNSSCAGVVVRPQRGRAVAAGAVVVAAGASTRVGAARGGSDEPVLLTTMTGTDWLPRCVRGPPGDPGLLLPSPRPLLPGVALGQRGEEPRGAIYIKLHPKATHTASALPYASSH